MQNTIASLALAVLVSPVAAGVVLLRSDGASSESVAVLAAEHDCAKALVDADLSTLDSCIADDYVEMIAGPAREGAAANWKTQSKKEWLDLVRSRREKYISVEIHNEKVFLHGDDDVVTVLAEYSQTAIKDGKQYSDTGPEIDTWKKRNGHWQVISSVFP